MKDIIKIVFVLIGTIIGAGFASGKEIFLFFSKYGNSGIIGIIFSNFLTCLIIYKTMRLINYYNLDSYNSLLCTIIPDNNTFIIKTFSKVINIFLYISFIIMISGFVSFFYETYSLNKFIMTIFISLICFYLFNNNITQIININTILIPFLIIIIICFSLKKWNIVWNFDFAYFNFNNLNWLFSAILYSSYNSILAIPIIFSLNKLINKFSNSYLKYTSFSVFIILTVLSISIINLLFSLDNNTITALDIPILFISKNMGYIYHFIYGFIIIIAIFTSAVSTGYSFLNIFKDSKYFIFISGVVCFSTIIFSNINFSLLVSSLYPIFGVLGIVQILYLLLKKIPKTDIN